MILNRLQHFPFESTTEIRPERICRRRTWPSSCHTWTCRCCTLNKESRRSVTCKLATLIWSSSRSFTRQQIRVSLVSLTHQSHMVCIRPSYSLSRKTVNARENFWNVYCFATNQMRDETAKDNRQTAAGFSHYLIWNNEQAFSSARNLQFSLWVSLKKLFFYHKPTPVTWFRLFRNQTTE